MAQGPFPSGPRPVTLSLMRALSSLALLLLVPSLACEEAAPSRPSIPSWRPGIALVTPRGPTVRGLLDRRGLIHAHSVYSHDACDGAPVDESGLRDPVCFDDFRAGLCETKQDFVMLTDHGDAFKDTEFPDALLYREARGDRLVERGGEPIASWARCESGLETLVMAGNEGGLMPVGIEGHPVPPEERGALYGDQSAAAAAALREAGAVVLIAHTEDFSPAQLAALDVDGFEMFNMHANTLLNAPFALDLLTRVNEEDPTLPYPDLVALTLLTEDERYLATWGTALASGRRFVTTMGSDCHRNTFRSLLSDGERVDSYRRAMSWFSNHLLVAPSDDGSYDDVQLKDALRQGRLYGSFDLLGYPEGFDYRAEAGDDVVEMGGEVPLPSAPLLVASMPRVMFLDDAAEPPALVMRLLRAREGGFDEVASVEEGEIRFAPDEPGAYRVEVRMVPFHLREYLNGDAFYVLGREFVWVYSNPIYVR